MQIILSFLNLSLRLAQIIFITARLLRQMVLARFECLRKLIGLSPFLKNRLLGVHLLLFFIRRILSYLSFLAALACPLHFEDLLGLRRSIINVTIILLQFQVSLFHLDGFSSEFLLTLGPDVLLNQIVILDLLVEFRILEVGVFYDVLRILLIWI